MIHSTTPDLPIMLTLRVTAVMFILGASGCIRGSLATDTGYSTEGAWSAAKVQDAHIGETVTCSLILRESFKKERLSLLGVADYAAAQISSDRVEAEPQSGRFVFRYTFKDVDPGRTVKVSARAYRIRKKKDYMKIQGQWLRSQSPYELPDRNVGADSLKLRFYQSRIEYSFEAPRTKLDWATSRLVITRKDKQISTVLMEKANRSGFTVNGPDRKGRYCIQYFPLAEQVNKTGETSVALYVLDINGQQHTYKFEFDTP